MIDEKKLIEELKVHFDSLYREDGMLLHSDHVCTAEDVDDLIALVNRQPKVGEWIPCSERLPKCEWGCETEALMYQLKNTGSIEVGYYGEGGHLRDRYFRTYRDSCEGVDASDVIAWMPLPEAYKGEKNNG